MLSLSVGSSSVLESGGGLSAAEAEGDASGFSGDLAQEANMSENTESRMQSIIETDHMVYALSLFTFFIFTSLWYWRYKIA